MSQLASIRAWLLRRPVLSFYLLTFGLEFGSLVALLALGRLSNTAVNVLLFLPTFGAVVLSAVEGGPQGIAALLRKFLVWRVGIQWYLFALLSPAAVALVVRGLTALAGGSVEPVRWYSLSGLFMAAIGAPLAEEAGWRGYVLPRLQSRMSALSASLIIGVLWGAVWHLPMFLGTAAGSFTVPFGAYVLLCVAWAIVFTWVYNHTRGSLLLAFLLHWACNVGTNMFPAWEGNQFLLQVALWWVVALAIVAVYGPRRLVRGDATRAAEWIATARPAGR